MTVSQDFEEMRRSSSRHREELPEVLPPLRAQVRAQSLGVQRPSDKDGGRQMFDKNELRSMHKETIRHE